MLTGLELTFMGLTRSNSSLFSTPGFVVSPLGKREKGDERKKKEKKRREGGKKEERKGGGKKE